MEKCVKLFLVLLLGLCMAGSVSAKETYTMKFAFQFPDKLFESNEASFANVFKTQVESASNGRIKVELYPGGVLGKERENFVNVQNNVIQATLSSVGGIAQFYKTISVVDIPFAFKTTMWPGGSMTAGSGKRSGPTSWPKPASDALKPLKPGASLPLPTTKKR